MKSFNNFLSANWFIAVNSTIGVFHELRRDVAISVEEMLESLDAVLEEVFKCVLLMLEMLLMHLLVL